MPSASMSLPRVLAGAVSAALLVGGCQTLDDAGRMLSQADLVNELAARLESAAALTYTADYHLRNGATGAIAQAQQPRRAAYSYPDGKIMVSTDATARCATAHGRTNCTLEPPPTPDTRMPLTSVASASRAGLVTPPVILALLSATALEPEALVEQRDTTVAGLHATCVQVTDLANAPTSAFDACVTSEGVLGSFRGMLDGMEIDTALSNYRHGVTGDSFALPDGTGVIDRRPGRS